MSKNIIILSAIFISSSVMASQDYLVTFYNNTGYDVKISVVPHAICMKSTGKDNMYIKAGDSYKTTIVDKNSGISCVDAYKSEFWNVYKNNATYYNQIKFNHNKGGGKWVTEITDKIYKISATCDGTPCSNTGKGGVRAGGPIDIYIK